MTQTSDITPFKIDVPEHVLTDLKAKLELTRYPDEFNPPSGEEWSYGAPVNVVKEAVEYWKNAYDWRASERLLNEKLPQFTAPIDTGDPKHGSLKVHFAHVRSSRPNAIPLLIVHGWPGNFAEILKMIDGLTEPSDPKHPAFHVVSPSVPGYGFSEAPKARGFGIRVTANVFDKLMKRLDYAHYIAQGGDWGAMVVRGLALWHPEGCRGIFSNMLIAHPSLLLWHPIMAGKLLLGLIGAPGGYPPIEIASFKRFVATASAETGYTIIQRDKPQTLGFAMTDSPSGLLAWVREKYEAWSDRYAWSQDELLMWTMLYWIPGPTPSFRYYRENFTNPEGKADMDAIIKKWSSVPLGVAIFPEDGYQLPDEWGNMLQPLKYVKRHDRGGHFAAWETPDLLLGDIREFASRVLVEDLTLLGSATATQA